MSVTGGDLRALRRARGWDVPRLARELREAADEPLPVSLDQMIRAWENGRYAPSERYEFLYRAVFPDLAVMMNGAGPMYGPDPDPAVVLERARHAPPDPAGLELAASASPEITALAARVAELRRQVEENTARLRQLLSEAGGEDCDDR